MQKSNNYLKCGNGPLNLLSFSNNSQWGSSRLAKVITKVLSLFFLSFLIHFRTIRLTICVTQIQLWTENVITFLFIYIFRFEKYRKVRRWVSYHIWKSKIFWCLPSKVRIHDQNAVLCFTFGQKFFLSRLEFLCDSLHRRCDAYIVTEIKEESTLI